jgi:4-hydroxybenzoate polyprenyltransferase
MHWLRLVRWPNLLIIAFTQIVAWWCMIYPLPGLRVLHVPAFAMLCLSSVFIAAAGYIINDYFDINIDAINKPGKVILERSIPRRLAIIVHSLLNVLAVILAAVIAIPAGHPEWLLVQLLCSVMLWRYSTHWKRQFVIGNMVVALMTALTVVVLIVYEPALKAAAAATSGVPGKPGPTAVLYGFAFFAFLLTWMREIVKDMEDYKGDAAEGCVTMPIRWGLLRSGRFVQALAGVAIVALLLASFMTGSERTGIELKWYADLIVVPALAIWAWKLPAPATVAHYHRASSQLKGIMILGIIALLIYHYG